MGSVLNQLSKQNMAAAQSDPTHPQDHLSHLFDSDKVCCACRLRNTYVCNVMAWLLDEGLHLKPLLYCAQLRSQVVSVNMCA